MLRPTHAAFLRALDAGDRRLTSDEVQAAVAPLDLAAVATWQQRGDVVFRPEDGADDSAELERRISGALEAELGVVAAVLELATEDDELEWRCRELWWLPRAEAADSALGTEQLEDALGVGALRSHRSVAGLLARHLAP